MKVKEIGRIEEGKILLVEDAGEFFLKLKLDGVTSHLTTPDDLKFGFASKAVALEAARKRWPEDLYAAFSEEQL